MTTVKMSGRTDLRRNTILLHSSWTENDSTENNIYWVLICQELCWAPYIQIFFFNPPIKSIILLNPYDRR